MTGIDRIYVMTHAGDVWLARTCVASIRHWYPTVPITLFWNSRHLGHETASLERGYAVEVLKSTQGRAHNSLAKFDLLTRPEGERYLFLDADIVLLGPVLDRLSSCDEDFVVAATPGTKVPPLHGVYDVEALIALDPHFRPPTFEFNTGQYIATSGLISRDELRPWIDFDRSPPRHRTTGVFVGADQGLSNYLFVKKAQDGELRLGTVPFMIWTHSAAAEALPFDPANQDVESARVMHWAGTQSPVFQEQPRTDVLDWFRRQYYRDCGVPPSEQKREWFEAVTSWALWRSRIKVEYALGIR